MAKLNMIIIIISCLLAALIIGCTAQNKFPAISGANAALMDTPASAKCAKDGGSDKALYGPDGKTYALCMFPDGSVCDESDYYNGKCHKGECIRTCQAVGTRSEGWYDCHGNLLFWDKCAGENVTTAGTC